jgi:alpha-ketoglutarate-dependent taurine dioxygenase
MLDTVELTPEIGSEVRISTEALVAGTHADELRELLVERGVIVVRDANLDDDQQRAFVATIGEVRLGTPYEAPTGGLLSISEIAGTSFWHMDNMYIERPPFAETLTAKVVPDQGGETEFADTYAAYEALPADEQEHLATLEVVHCMKTAMDRFYFEPTLEQLEDWMKHKRTQPLVWQHRNGRRSLIVGTTASHVVGMHPSDSKELLDRLLAHTTQDRFVYRHSWRVGDLVMWDNTGTLHRLRPFDPSATRELHRLCVEGVETFRGVAQLSNA